MAKLPPAFRTVVDGRDLVESIADLFGTKSAWIQATGYVEHVEVKLPTDGADTRRLFRGRYALAQLMGPLGGPYGVTLSRVDSGNLEIIAGTLVAARSAGVHVLCLGSDGDVAVARGPVEAQPAPTGAAAPQAAAAEAAESKPAEVSGGWAARAHAAAAAQAVPEDEGEPPDPERGDLVQHFAFGLCEVLTSSGDKLMIRDMTGQGRIREIRITMLNVERPTERNGKRLFRLTRKS